MQTRKTNENQEKSRWYTQWFGTPHYNLLYQHRSDEEAQRFVEALCRYEWFTNEIETLDLGCGNGRHTKALSPYVKSITGIDLSEKQLELARLITAGHSNCQFFQCDMRSFDLGKSFDLVLNLFTSFGYFREMKDNIEALERIKKHLKPSGIFILDYLNTRPLQNSIIKEESKVIGDTCFQIKREIKDGRIMKYITVDQISYKEDIALWDFDQLQFILSSNGFECQSVHGDYNLESFAPETSPRCIIFAKRK